MRVVPLVLALLLAGCLGPPADLALEPHGPETSAAPGPTASASSEEVAAGACADVAPLPPCNLWASRPPTGPANEVHIAVNPTNPLHLLAAGKDYGLGANSDCRPSGAFHVASASYVTFDGGQTWDTTRVPAPYPNGGAEPSPLRYRCGSDPVVAFSPNGVAYYILLNFQYTGGRQASIAVARSPDGGLTWPAEDIRVVHTSGGDDKEWGAVDSEERVHVAWVDGGRILYSRSDPSFHFEPARQVASAGGGNPAIEVAVGPADEVYLVWRSGSSIRFTRSLDHGATFEPIRTAFNVNPYEVSGPPRLPFMPHIAVDRNPDSPFAGRLYLTWPDTRLGDSAVFMASSGDGGATWTAATRVDDNGLPQRRQVMPSVSVAPNGRVDLAWLDERLDPGGAPSNLAGSLLGLGGTWTAWVAHSFDGGATWSPNRLVSDSPMGSSWSFHQDGSVFIGDYLGIASTDTHAWPIWPGNSPTRLAQGLAPDRLAQVDATTAAVDPAPLGLPVGPAPPGVVRSVLALDPALPVWDGTFLD